MAAIWRLFLKENFISATNSISGSAEYTGHIIYSKHIKTPRQSQSNFAFKFSLSAPFFKHPLI